MDGCISTNLQRKALPQPQACPQEAGSALQTDVLHSCLPTTTSKCFSRLPSSNSPLSAFCFYHDPCICSQVLIVLTLYFFIYIAVHYYILCLSGTLLGFLCPAERCPIGVQQRPCVHPRGTETYSTGYRHPHDTIQEKNKHIIHTYICVPTEHKVVHCTFFFFFFFEVVACVCVYIVSQLAL